MISDRVASIVGAKQHQRFLCMKHGRIPGGNPGKSGQNPDVGSGGSGNHFYCKSYSDISPKVPHNYSASFRTDNF